MEWLFVIAVVSLAAAASCSLIVAADIFLHPQKMWIMNVVWPMTALYSGPPGLIAYFRLGRLSSREAMQAARDRGEKPPAMTKPFWQSTGLAATHCGAGCTLGDIIAEWAMFFIPWTLFGWKIFAAWIADYVLAYVFGIAFQYFTIKPMKQLSVGRGILEAVKADTLSLTAWQVGMYGWMAITTFAIFGFELKPTDPVFWLMMQIAMITGFMTAYPVNWWLLKKGIKEKM